MIEAIVILWALGYAIAGASKALAGAAASGARSGARSAGAAAARRTAAARASSNPWARAAGRTAQVTGAVGGAALRGLGRGAVAGGRAAVQGARAGWQRGRQAGRQQAPGVVAAGRNAGRAVAGGTRKAGKAAAGVARKAGRGATRTATGPAQRVAGWWRRQRGGKTARPEPGVTGPADGGGDRPPPVQGTITVDTPPPPQRRPVASPLPPTPPRGTPAGTPLPDPPPRPLLPPSDGRRRDQDRGRDCKHLDAAHALDGVITCPGCGTTWMCTDPSHQHLTQAAVPEHLRCEWQFWRPDDERCPAAATLIALYRGVTRRYCDPHAITVAETARDEGQYVQWFPFNPDQTAIEGGTDVSAPAVPTGEIQGKADTERALEAYRGAATTYQDDLAAMAAEAAEMQAMANRLAEQLAASELGNTTLQAVARVQEEAGALAREADQLGPACEAVLAVLSEFDAAVAAHDNVEAAALANADGGTTEFHNA